MNITANESNFKKVASKHKEMTLPQLIGKYATFELQINNYEDCIRPEIGYIDLRSEKSDYTYFLKMDWVDGKCYANFAMVSEEAVRDCKFDIVGMEVDKMIDSFIKYLEEIEVHADNNE